MTLRSSSWLLLVVIACLFVNNHIRVVWSKPTTSDIFINAPINIDIEGENEISGMESNVDLSINGDVVNNKNGAETDQMEPLCEPAWGCEDSACDSKNCCSKMNEREEIAPPRQGKDIRSFLPNGFKCLK